MKYLVLTDKKISLPSWATDRFSFDIQDQSFKQAPMFKRDDGRIVIDIKWLLNKCDTTKYNGLIACVSGDKLKGVRGTHNGFMVGNKKISILQVENIKKYKEWRKKGLVWELTTTSKKTEYPYFENTFIHELTHSYKYQKGETDLLHFNIGIKNFDNYVNAIPIGLIKPIKEWDKISQKFGNIDWKLYPLTGIHWGTDFAVPIGTPIYAPAKGFIKVGTKHKSFGNYLEYCFEVKGELYTMVCMHLSKFSTTLINFESGDIIGYTGNTGQTTGPHLHLELWKGLMDRSVLTKPEAKKIVLDPIGFF